MTHRAACYPALLGALASNWRGALPPRRPGGAGRGSASQPRPGAGTGSGKRPPPGQHDLGNKARRAGRGGTPLEGVAELPGDRPTRAALPAPATMGLETEKADVQLIMADDAYSHHSGVEYADPEKYVDSSHDRDPHRLNSHLKVSFRPAVT